MQQLSIRRGDIFFAACQLVDEFDAAAPITGLVVQARLLDRGGNIAHTFGITVLNENQGLYGLNELDTAIIPPALYTLQINYLRNGVKISTTAFELNVAKLITAEPVRFAQVGSIIGNTRVLITVPASELDLSLWDAAWDVEWV